MVNDVVDGRSSCATYAERALGRSAALVDIAQDLLLGHLVDAGIFEHLVFKGGTALRKTYAGNAGRFSTDLDFSLLTLTEGHYIEQDRSIDPTPAAHLERTLRPVEPDGALLAQAAVVGEGALLAAVDREGDDDAVA